MAISSLMAATLLFGTGQAHATPQPLTPAQLDQVSAGTQYSTVEGAGAAQLGTVRIRSSTQAIDQGDATITKASLKVEAVGTGLDAYAAGESGAGSMLTSVSGIAAVEQGRLVIALKTRSQLNDDGTGATQSFIRVKGTGQAAVVVKAQSSF